LTRKAYPIDENGLTLDLRVSRIRNVYAQNHRPGQQRLNRPESHQKINPTIIGFHTLPSTQWQTGKRIPENQQNKENMLDKSIAKSAL
jgi:hypothetical protein